MTDRKETTEERIRREVEEADRIAMIADWKRKMIFSLLLSIWTAALVSLLITIVRSP